jgi:hypothetical protein
MALLRKKYGEIPPDAVVLTEEEAFKYQTKILNSWTDQSDVLGYKFGRYFLATASALSGLYINNHYRNKFKLFHYGRLSTYLPLCFLPSAFSMVLHMELVLKDVVLQKRNSCLVCLEMRGSAMQAMVGCAFPLLLAPVACLSLAHRYFTIQIPDVVREPGQLLKFIHGKTKPVANVLFAIFIGQALLGSVVTYWEAQSVITVNRKLALLEQQLENM